jgi:gluconolactonase
MKTIFGATLLTFGLLALNSYAAESTIIAPGAKVETLSDKYQFTEGPTADADGNVYFTDQPNNQIVKWSVADGALSQFLKPAGRANGMYFFKGNLIACADEKNELWSIDVATAKPTVIITNFEGKLLNGPNDVWVRPGGEGMYLTDPYFARSWWKRGPKESPECVYYLTMDGKKMVRVVDDMRQPNGIMGTPDGKTLYVADMGGRKTFSYEIQKDGSLTNKQAFCNMGSDGMTIDNQGNLYMTGRGVTVFDKTGKQLEQIAVPGGQTANVCFGGKDRQTLFITGTRYLYSIKMQTKGVGSK